MHTDEDERNAQIDRLYKKAKLEAAVAHQHAQEANRLMVRAMLEHSQPDLLVLVEYNWYAQWHAGQAAAYLSAADMLMWKWRVVPLSVEQGANLINDMEGLRANVATQAQAVELLSDQIRDYTPAKLAEKAKF